MDCVSNSSESLSARMAFSLGGPPQGVFGHVRFAELVAFRRRCTIECCLVPNCPHLPISLLTLQPASEVDAAAGRGELDAATDGEEVNTGREALDAATGLNASTRL
jgi:hypothetical protein